MKFGFIGTGNIATAVITGAVSDGKFFAENINAYNLQRSAQDALCNATGINGFDSAEEVVNNSEVVVFAVKPNVLIEILPGLAPLLKGKLLVSVAAGVELARLESSLGFELPIVRVMPNLNSMVGAGMTAYCGNKLATDEDKRVVAEFFNASGSVTELDETYFAIFSALSGSSPAFTYLFIDSLAKAAHKLGMNKEQAIQIAAQSVLGSAKMLLDNSDHPWVLIDKVCSPGGMTIEGICSLQESGFESAVVGALVAAIKKSGKLVK